MPDDRKATAMNAHSTQSEVPRRRADARRNVERIIDAATNLLAEKPAASMAAVAEASGVVRATVYRHFPSREDLLRAILDRALDAAADAIAAAELERGTAPEAARRLIEGLIGVGSRFRIVVDQPLQDPSAMERGIEIGAPIVALALRGQREGDLRSDMPAAWLAATLGGLATEAIRAVGRGDLAPEQAAGVAATTFLDGGRGLLHTMLDRFAEIGGADLETPQRRTPARAADFGS